jgi:hypothetical protein
MSEEIDESEEIGNVNLAISKHYFTLEGIGPIDSDVPVVDEVQAFCNLLIDSIAYHKKRSSHNDMFIQILQFYALLAYEANALAGDLKHADLALRMTALYQDLMQNLHLKEEYQEVFFKKWPNGKLPDAYINWVDAKFAAAKNGTIEALNAWTAKEFPKHKSATEDVKRKLHFGVYLLQLAVVHRFRHSTRLYQGFLTRQVL